jgi:exosome complex RNA-binding protein Csl4
MPYWKLKDNSESFVFQISIPDIIKCNKKEYLEIRKESAKRFLLSVLKPGDTVYGSVLNVSRSGMSRNMKLYTVQDGEMLNITWHVAQLAGEALDKNDCLRVGGCGMDMVFATVYNLGLRLWPDGTPEPHGSRNGELDYDGGYALKHSHL